MALSDCTSSSTLRGEILVLWSLLDRSVAFAGLTLFLQCGLHASIALWRLKIALLIQATEALALYHNEVR